MSLRKKLQHISEHRNDHNYNFELYLRVCFYRVPDSIVRRPIKGVRGCRSPNYRKGITEFKGEGFKKYQINSLAKQILNEMYNGLSESISVGGFRGRKGTPKEVFPTTIFEYIPFYDMDEIKDIMLNPHRHTTSNAQEKRKFAHKILRIKKLS